MARSCGRGSFRFLWQSLVPMARSYGWQSLVPMADWARSYGSFLWQSLVPMARSYGWEGLVPMARSYSWLGLVPCSTSPPIRASAMNSSSSGGWYPPSV